MQRALTPLLALTLALPAAALAQDNTVKTEAHIAHGAAARTPARVDSLRADDLLRQGATDLASALSWLAGATPTTPTGTATGMIIDGLSASQVVVLRDGLPFARMSGSPDGPLVDLSSIPIDPATIERIDVYRGSGPSGTGGAGGIVVDIITRRPDRGAQEGFARSLSAADTSSPFRQEVAAGGAVSLSDQWSIQGMGQWADISAVDVNGDGRGDNPALTRTSGELVAQRRAGRDNLRLALLGGSQTTRSSVAPTSPLEDQVEASSARLRLQGRWWSGQDMRLDHGLDAAWDQHDFSKLVRASGQLRPKADTQQLAARHNLLATWFLPDHDLQTELIFGGAHIKRSGETGELPAVALADLGVGLADTWYAADWMEVQGRIYGDVHTGFGAGWSAQIAAIWKPHKAFTPRASLSRSRRLPTPEERFLLFDHSEVGYRILGNPDLGPESLRSARLGFVWSPAKLVHVEAEGFVHDISDAIVTAGVDGANGAATFTYINASGATAAGVNASLRWGGLPGGLALAVSHAWLPVSEDDAGQPLPLRAQHSTRAELRGRWLGGALEAWGDVQARSALATPPAQPAAPAYAQLGLGARWQALDALSVALDVNNLLNQTNATWGPVPGLHALLTLELRARSDR
jgi:outer membrane receptor for ferrienterochelin and colicins